MSEEQYFLRLRGKVRGPFTADQLRRMQHRGQFSKLHQVSTDKKEWEPAENLNLLIQNTSTASTQVAESADAADSAEWHYTDDGQQQGPVPTETLRQMLNSGQLSDETMVWRTGWSDWVLATEAIPGLQANRSAQIQRRVLFSVAGLLLLLTASGVVWYVTSGQSSRDLQAMFSPGEIHSMDLSQSAVDESVGDAIGMVVSYVELVEKTGERHEKSMNTGTSFVVTQDGVALTNRHVVDQYQQWTDATAEGRVQLLAEHNLKMVLSSSSGKLSFIKHVLTLAGNGDPIARSCVENDKLDIVKYTHAMIDSCTQEITPRLVVYFGDEKHNATVRYISTKYDLAVLDLEDWPKSRPFFALSKTNEASKTTDVVALGFPGITQTAYSDDEQALAESRIASSFEELFLGRESHSDYFKSSAYNYVSTAGTISVIQEEAGGVFNAQHTAKISSGNSGGPLVFRGGTTSGVVFGINTLRNFEGVDTSFVAFQVSQMNQELEDDAEIKGLTWR